MFRPIVTLLLMQAMVAAPGQYAGAEPIWAKLFRNHRVEADPASDYRLTDQNDPVGAGDRSESNENGAPFTSSHDACAFPGSEGCGNCGI